MTFGIDFIWVLGGRVATALISIASLRILTTLLEPADFGLYALLLAFHGCAALILLSPVGLHINRNMHAWWDENTLLSRLYLFNKYLFFVSVGIAVAVICWWLIYQATDQNIYGAIFASIAVGLTIFLSTWCGLFVQILNMLGFRAASAGWMTASSIIGLGFSSLFTYKYHTGTSWLLGQTVGMAVGAIGAGLMLCRYQVGRKFVVMNFEKLPPLLDRQTIVHYCLPLAIATGLMWLQNTGYRFWVGGAWGAAELGLLAVGLSISAQIWAIIETLSMQFLNPYLFRHITDVKSDSQKSVILSDMVNIMWPVYAVLAGFNVIFASSLLKMLTNERYHAAVSFVLLGVFIEFFRCTANLWSYAAQIERSTTKYIWPYGFGAIIVWLGAIAITYVNGDIIYIAIVLAISGFGMCVVMLRVMQFMIPVTLDVRRWAAGAAVLLACTASVIVIPIRTDGFIINIGLIILGLIVSGSVMLALLWRNPALTRLLAVTLRNA